jgi:hypothetical protein
VSDILQPGAQESRVRRRHFKFCAELLVEFIERGGRDDERESSKKRQVEKRTGQAAKHQGREGRAIRAGCAMRWQAAKSETRNEKVEI